MISSNSIFRKNGRNSKGSRFGKKDLAIPLMITSLVDAFSILVIYLMINAASENQVELAEEIKIPTVQKASDLTESPVISISTSGYNFNKQVVDINGLRKIINQNLSLFKEKKAIVEADKETPYSKIQPIMALMSELEIETIQLAVVTEERL